MRKSLYRLAALGVLVGLLSLSGVVSRAPARAAQDKAGKPSGEATDRLLQAAKLDYKRKDNLFRVLIEVKGEITPIMIEERRAPWKANNGDEVLFAYIFSEVLALPADFKPPSGMLQRVAEMNDAFNFGCLGLSKRPDGGQSIFLNMSTFLRGCDAEQLTDYLYVMHYTRLSLRKELSKFLEER
jgi:hypothetical protein